MSFYLEGLVGRMFDFYRNSYSIFIGTASTLYCRRAKIGKLSYDTDH